MNILLGATGSVAAIKFWKLYDALSEIGDVKGVLTKSADYFVWKAEKVPDITKANAPLYYSDLDEWQWQKVGDRVLHIELRDWADVLVIAPLSANTLAKMTHGLCDNLLTSVYRAWPMNKPIVVAPAMNTQMWEHPLTNSQLTELQQRHVVTTYATVPPYKIPRPTVFERFHIVQPISRNLACGTTGMGAMAHTSDIVSSVAMAMNEYNEDKDYR
jgi:phosphopantothenoylcysteine decarboxylase